MTGALVWVKLEPPSDGQLPLRADELVSGSVVLVDD